ncbi:MAG: glycosyltransferase family 4 protein [Candidatus Liptonbacteria bacterium]|nr:glycosyltransferase family 4 protein [Parcubacteria group bacterium]MBI4087340.1 glycosyltransferase family 4 protein [Candidatus Liptonbacteria bacterium]
MKIAIACYNIDWPAGGPRLLFSSAKALEKLGHKVVIYAPQFEGRYFKELWAGLDIRVVPPKYPFVWEGRPSFFKWIWKKFKQERLHLDTSKRIAKAMDKDFDVANLHDYAYRIAPFYKKINPKAKILWTSNDPPYTYLPKKNPLKAILSKLYNVYRNWASRRYFKYLDAIAVLDEYNRAWCEAHGLKANIVYLGADFEKFYIPIRNFAEKAAQKKVKLFGLGALNKYRRYEDTIMAVKFLRDWGYDASAHIICNDTWRETTYREELIGLIEKNNLRDFVRLNFNGATDAEIHEAQKEADVFVYAVYLPPPRHGFGFSIAVVEVMAAGLPVVICSTTTSNEVLRDGATALFFEPQYPRQIAEKIKLLVDHPEIYKKIAEAAQRLVREELTWENYAKKLLALVE